MINGSFIFGLDNDTVDVFDRTTEWAVKNGIATASNHILTPYPGTWKKFESVWNFIIKNELLGKTRGTLVKTLK